MGGAFHRGSMTAMMGRFGLGGAADFTRRLLIDFLESDDCDLGSIQLWRADYEAVAKRLGWREHHTSWDAGGGLLSIPLDREPDNGEWFAAWRSELGSYVNNQELVRDMREMYTDDSGVTLVWPGGVKAEYSADAEEHNEELEARLRRPIKDVIIIDLEDETPSPTPDSVPLVALGTWEPKERTNYIYLYFDAVASNDEMVYAVPSDSEPSAANSCAHPSAVDLSIADSSANDRSAASYAVDRSAVDPSIANPSATASSPAPDVEG